MLKGEVDDLMSQKWALGITETNTNVIHMGNIANQLLNKMIRFMKPNLSKRAASDADIYGLRKEKKFEELTDFIKKYEAKLSVFDLVRSINVLKKEHVEKAHDEHPISDGEIDSILAGFISCNDQYLNEHAKVVVGFLKILAGHLNESCIVDLR
jgi:hypothetical protein